MQAVAVIAARIDIGAGLAVLPTAWMRWWATRRNPSQTSTQSAVAITPATLISSWTACFAASTATTVQASVVLRQASRVRSG